MSAKKIRSAVTDSGREVVFDPEGKPGVANLLTIHAPCPGEPSPSSSRTTHGRGYGDLKKDVAAAVEEFVVPFRERTLELLDDRPALDASSPSGPPTPARSRARRWPPSTTGSASCRRGG